MRRRSFLETVAGGLASAALPLRSGAQVSGARTPLVSVTDIPDNPYWDVRHPNRHAGFETLLYLLDAAGLPFYRTASWGRLSGPFGLIAADDVVLIKINSLWKYRGVTNSDLVRGILQRILDHPDGFRGEAVLVECSQGYGSLNCDTAENGYPDGTVHANARDERHSFRYLIDQIFKDVRVSGLLLDPFRETFLAAGDHAGNGFRRYEDVSYPCFHTPGRRRVELREGIWTGGGYASNLKLINVPVLKTHDGSGFTGVLKHFYGLLSMADGNSPYRHYGGLGPTCGKMVVSVRAPVLNVVDAIWVSQGSLEGYPASTTTYARRLAASQDPVALDAWAARHILYPIDRNDDHDPKNAVISGWLADAAAMINGRGGLYDPARSLFVERVTADEAALRVLEMKTPTPPPAPAGGFTRYY